jgi:glycosyltransferase involved in cell wall biosynthesis
VNRRLLLLCYFYPPLGGGGVQRVLGFTRWLPRFGWDCTVVCAGPEDYWVKDETLMRQVPPGTEVIRVPGGSALSAWLRLRGGGGGRRSGATFAGLRSLSDWWLLPDSYAGWAGRARRTAAARIARGGVDVMLSSSPPDSVHLAAGSLARRFRLPWAADFRDPWIHLYRRRPPTAWHAARQREMERGVLAGADLVLVTSRTHAGALARDPAAAGRRVECLPNGYEPDGTGAVPARDPDHFLLVFTGMLTLTPDVETLLEALHELLARRPEARRRIRVKLAGPYEADYADRATALGLTGIVEFTGPVAHARARELQRAADALILWKPVGCDAAIPAKVYEYLDAGRPVLALLDEHDEAARMVRDAGATRVAPGDRAALAAEIERLYLAWKEGGTGTGAAPGAGIPARPGWLAEHTRERLGARLAALLDGLAGAPGGGGPAR